VNNQLNLARLDFLSLPHRRLTASIGHEVEAEHAFCDLRRNRKAPAGLRLLGDERAPFGFRQLEMIARSFIALADRGITEARVTEARRQRQRAFRRRGRSRRLAVERTCVRL
jgi:hypothetical protein